MNDQAASPRKLPFWLVISLMANMLLVGLVAGVLLRPAPQGTQPDRRHERFSWAERDGGRNGQIALVFREAFEASEEQRAARAEARRILGEAVAKDPYDPDAVRAAFEGLRLSDDEVNESTHAVMVKMFADLSAEDRQVMAKFLMRGPGDHKRMRPGDRMVLRRMDGERGGGGPGPDGEGSPPPPPDFEP